MGQRYDPTDFDGFPEFLEAKATPVSSKVASNGKVISGNKAIEELANKLKFNANAQPDFELFSSLSTAFGPVFKLTWEGKRKASDFTNNDDSPSTYDYTLCIYMAKVNLPGQEMLNIMIAFRRKHGHDLKFDNKQYYARTIIMARATVENEKEKQEVDKILSIETVLLNTNYEDKSPEGIKYRRGLLVKILRVPDIRILTWKTDPMVVELYIGNEKRTKDNLHFVEDQGVIRGIISDIIGRKAPRFKKNKWSGSDKTNYKGIEDLFYSISEPQNLDDLPKTPEEQIVYYMEDYLKDKELVEIEATIVSKEPFVSDGNWHIRLDEFIKWIKLEKDGDRKLFTSGKLPRFLKKMGCTRPTKSCTLNKERYWTRCWEIPTSICAPPDQKYGKRLETDDNADDTVDNVYNFKALP